MRVRWMIVSLLVACSAGDDPPGGTDDEPADSEAAIDPSDEDDPAVETDTEDGSPAPVEEAPWGDRTPTFAEIGMHVIRVRCVNACHINPKFNGNLLLEGNRADHGRIVNVPSDGRPDEFLVVPGDPDASYLFRKLTGEDVEGARMPVGAKLPDWALEGIRAWIASGAPNDGAWSR